MVTPDNAEFLGEIARQLASVSAFLGGFAATFLGSAARRIRFVGERNDQGTVGPQADQIIQV